MTGTPEQRERFAHQVFRWCLQRHGEAAKPTPTLIGLNAPQGTGKTTLGVDLLQRFAHAGLRAVVLSVDDFYWPRATQQALAAQHPDNPYLQQRGYPGTHDIALGTATLQALLHAQPGQRVPLPQYDKSQHHGRGDRVPQHLWPIAKGPLDIVLLEGWMLGFAPVALELVAHDPALAEINARLADYRPWTERLDALLHLTIADPTQVVTWRCQAEAHARAQGRPALTPAEVEAYAQTFVPALALYPAALQAAPPLSPPRYCVLPLGPDRLPKSEAPPQFNRRHRVQQVKT